MQKKIDNLIAKRLSGNASPEDLVELNAWITANAQNEAYFNEAEKAWKLSATFSVYDDQADVDAAWSEFTGLTRQTIKHSMHPVFTYLKAAAAIVLIVSTFFFVRFFVFSGKGQQPALASNVQLRADTFSAPELMITQLADSAISEVPTTIPNKKLRRQVRPQVAMIAVSSEDSAMVFILPDNSKVYLNKHSKLVYPEKFGKTDRSVYLSGEAYFELASAPGEFFVYCHETRTRAIAGSFNVKGLRDGQVSISAVEGQVEVGRRDVEGLYMLVKAGEQVTYNTTTHQVAKTNLSKKEKWWRRGNFRMKVRDFFNKIIHPRAKDSLTILQ